MNNEVWKPIVGFESLYCVSNLGRVKSLNRKWANWKIRIVRQHKNPDGYFVMSLTKDKKKFPVRVHRLVADAFIANPQNKPVVNHKNGIKTDNRPENLEWCTIQDNCLHAHRTGLQPSRKGIKNPWASLTESDVLEIFHSELPNPLLAFTFGITRDAVSLIKTGKNWSHVTGKTYERQRIYKTTKAA